MAADILRVLFYMIRYHGAGLHIPKGVEGHPELLRLLRAGLVQLHSTHHELAQSEREFLMLWLIQLAGYCSGSMDRSEHPDLVDALAQVPWMPEISPRVREFVLTRLAECTPAGSAALAQSATVDEHASAIGPPTALQATFHETARAREETGCVR